MMNVLNKNTVALHAWLNFGALSDFASVLGELARSRKRYMCTRGPDRTCARARHACIAGMQHVTRGCSVFKVVLIISVPDNA